MGFFGFIGLLVFIYYLIQIISWCVLDSDIELFILSKLGKPICEFLLLFIYRTFKIFTYIFLLLASLKGKVVWITGASSGIGKDLAIALAKNGVKLCLSARNKAELLKVKHECLGNVKMFIYFLKTYRIIHSQYSTVTCKNNGTPN